MKGENYPSHCTLHSSIQKRLTNDFRLSAHLRSFFKVNKIQIRSEEQFMKYTLTKLGKKIRTYN